MRSTVPRSKSLVPNPEDQEEERGEAVIMGNNTPKKNRPDQVAAEQKLADGMNKHAATITSIVIAGATMTTKDILATLQTLINSEGRTPAEAGARPACGRPGIGQGSAAAPPSPWRGS
jgi:hypothetical protein